MAFNVFGHLSKHLDLATGLFRSILGPDEVGELTGIDIERLSPALRDRTAFDAFATYQRPDGTPGCVAVETKLTEKFSQQPYNWETYLNHPAFDPAVWTTTDPNVLGDKRWSQLWRNHLLARAATTTNPDLGTASVLVVHHPQDPHCADAVAGYRRLLTDPDTVQPVDLMEIRAALGELVEGDPDQEAWLADLYDRYLNLRLSDGLVGLNDLAP